MGLFDAVAASQLGEKTIATYVAKTVSPQQILVEARRTHLPNG